MMYVGETIQSVFDSLLSYDTSVMTRKLTYHCGRIEKYNYFKSK